MSTRGRIRGSSAASGSRCGKNLYADVHVRWPYPAATPATIAYTPNALDRYAAIGSVAPTYDANGDLTYDGTFTYG
jgi:hypothetical protein